eukprot:TRINITY_DN4064_c0_g1_i2.p1 TRINITY_DN4064_c0_g1~~TRINITY_DN4064_c0_g1_i2.p1  ORF type:complete len:549 (+),score=101.80 TRINITY_DN4064_c0_g1_i2:57-1649(+)
MAPVTRSRIAAKQAVAPASAKLPASPAAKRAPSSELVAAPLLSTPAKRPRAASRSQTPVSFRKSGKTAPALTPVKLEFGKVSDPESKDSSYESGAESPLSLAGSDASTAAPTTPPPEPESPANSFMVPAPEVIEPAQIIGRESERAALEKFLKSCFTADDTDANRTIYVSGGPGTGKTCCVRSIVHKEMQSNPEIRYVEVNCMKLAQKTISALLVHIAERCAGKEVVREIKNRPGNVAALILAKHLGALRVPLVLLIDEVDQLVKRGRVDAASACALETLFSLPRLSGAPQMSLFAIANAVDLLEHAPTVRELASSLLFEPYTTTQLREIFTAKLRASDQGDAAERSLGRMGVEVRVRQVAKQSGDCRQLLSFCRQAILTEVGKECESNLTEDAASAEKEAKPSNASPATSKVDLLLGGHLPMEHQILLCAMAGAKSETVRFPEVCSRFKEVCRLLHQDAELASKGSVAAALSALKERGLLSIGNGRGRGRAAVKPSAWGEQVVELAVSKKALCDSLTRMNPSLKGYLQA